MDSHYILEHRYSITNIVCKKNKNKKKKVMFQKKKKKFANRRLASDHLRLAMEIKPTIKQDVIYLICIIMKGGNRE